MTQPTAIYDPTQQYELKTFDVEYSQAGGQAQLVRIYQPQGAGPFPALLDVHGGAWNAGDRMQSEPRSNALASSGLLVASIDFRLAPEHPYPAQVEDTNYATRWLKAHAQEFNGDASTLGGFGGSSGGHTIMLSTMRPFDQRYSAISLTEGQDVDATLAYIVMDSPVLDSYARYLYAKESNNEGLVESTRNYFLTEETMQEGNPQMALERGEDVELPPSLLIQGTADANVPMSIPKRFVESYREAGGSIDLAIFPDMPHSFTRTPGPEADRAIDMMKSFIASQL